MEQKADICEWAHSSLTWVASPSALKQPISNVPISALQHAMRSN